MDYLNRLVPNGTIVALGRGDPAAYKQATVAIANFSTAFPKSDVPAMASAELREAYRPEAYAPPTVFARLSAWLASLRKARRDRRLKDRSPEISRPVHGG